MRLDDAGPRTWLLAAVAGWALAAWLLAAAGMGGAVEPLADDPGLLQPLPPVRPSPPLRLGPLGQYDAIASRPLFSEDREPQPFFLQGEGEESEDRAFDYVLTSVLITPQLEMAILQPREGGESVRVRLDHAPQSHPAWRLVGLDQRSAVFEGPEGPLTLQLRVYDGVGGERPTAVARPRQADRSRIPIIPPPRAGRVDDAVAKPPAAVESAAAATPEAPAEDEVADDAGFADEMTEQAQMDAIRERIEARRDQLRNEQKSQPPVDSP
ncbi:MAG: type II secretion system protein XpsN [Lysobacter sp.]